MDPLDWIPGLCDRMAIQPDDDILTALSLWAKSEGMPDSARNVLAATDKVKGSKTYNGAGVQVYPSVSVMNDVYARKLLSSTYGGIGNAMASGNMLDIFNAINDSPWCRGCQGGDYPNQLHNFLVATGALPGATFTQVFSNAPGQTGPASEAWNDQIAATRLCVHDVAIDAGKHGRSFAGLRY